MIYPRRNQDGNLRGFDRWPSPGTGDGISEDSQEFKDFLSEQANKKSKRDKLVDVLVTKKILTTAEAEQLRG